MVLLMRVETCWKCIYLLIVDVKKEYGFMQYASYMNRNRCTALIITGKVWGTLILLKLKIEGWPRFLMREKQCFLLMCIQRIMLWPKQ